MSASSYKHLNPSVNQSFKMKLFSIISTASLITAVAAIPSTNEAEHREIHQGMKREEEDNRRYIV